MTTSDDPRSKHVPPEWRQPITDWAGHMAAASLSRETIATRTDHLRRTARAMTGSPWSVDPAKLVAWCGRQVWSRETRRSVYASLRQFWRWAITAGLTEQNPSLQLPSVRAAEPTPRPAPDPITTAAIDRADPRTALILRCAVDAGLRRGEISRINTDDLSPDLEGWSLLVHGKGGRERTVPLPDGLALDLRTACLAGGGWAFPGQVNGHLSARRVGELATDALPGVWTLHTLRHSYATRIHDATHDLIAVQHLLGHASVATTQTYVATDAARLRQAVTISARAA